MHDIKLWITEEWQEEAAVGTNAEKSNTGKKTDGRVKNFGELPLISQVLLRCYIDILGKAVSAEFFKGKLTTGAEKCESNVFLCWGIL